MSTFSEGWRIYCVLRTRWQNRQNSFR